MMTSGLVDAGLDLEIGRASPSLQSAAGHGATFSRGHPAAEHAVEAGGKSMARELNRMSQSKYRKRMKVRTAWHAGNVAIATVVATRITLRACTSPFTRAHEGAHMCGGAAASTHFLPYGRYAWFVLLPLPRARYLTCRCFEVEVPWYNG